MAVLNIVKLDEEEKWDNLIKGFSEFDIYYLSGYVKTFQLHGDGEPLLFYYDNGNTRAINVVMKRDISRDKRFAGKIPENTYFDLATPYGYGGFIFEGDKSKEAVNKLDEIYIEYCRKNNIVCEICRFHPVIENHKDTEKIYTQRKLGNTVSINLESSDSIWSNFTSQCRNKIKKAKKNGVDIFWAQNKTLINDFIRLYNSTMERDHALAYYYFNKEFYELLLEELKFNSLIFFAKYEEQIVAISIILCCNKQMHYHLTGSLREYMHLAPLNLLLYEAAFWGLENGYKTFHLGGGLGAQDDNLYTFKKSFNRSSEYYFVLGKKIFDEENYNMLIQIRLDTNEYDDGMEYFPKYRG